VTAYRLLAVLVLAWLWPLCGAFGATLPCAHAPHDSGDPARHATADARQLQGGLHAEPHAGADAQVLPADGAGLRSPACAVCDFCAGCHAAALASLAPVVPGAPLPAAAVFPAPALPPLACRAQRQERPPRTV
jgi:hypothetical protein